MVGVWIHSHSSLSILLIPLPISLLSFSFRSTKPLLPYFPPAPMSEDEVLNMLNQTMMNVVVTFVSRSLTKGR
jgi:hypothetical protein